MTDLNLDDIEARRDDAYDEVVRLCDGKRWLMSVPADASRDSDLLITASLDDVPALVARVRELEAEVDRLRAVCDESGALAASFAERWRSACDQRDASDARVRELEAEVERQRKTWARAWLAVAHEQEVAIDGVAWVRAAKIRSALASNSDMPETCAAEARVRELEATVQRVRELRDEWRHEAAEAIAIERSTPDPSTAMIAVAHTVSLRADILDRALDGEGAGK